MPARPRLDARDVESFLESHPGWRLEQGEIRRTYDFASFADSLKFVNEVGALAERESHHPDIDLRYRRVTIALLTYDADGITARDTAMAEMIDAVRNSLPRT